VSDEDDFLPNDLSTDPVQIRQHILEKLKNQLAAMELGQVYCGDFQLSVRNGRYELNFPPVPEHRREEMIKIGHDLVRNLSDK
jgi:hypothetical protein